MQKARRPVSAARFVRIAELLDQAFPRAAATPDHLSHHAEKAEQALLTSAGRSGITHDERLAVLLSLTHIAQQP
jgi:hypothetical protein